MGKDKGDLLEYGKNVGGKSFLSVDYTFSPLTLDLQTVIVLKGYILYEIVYI